MLYFPLCSLESSIKIRLVTLVFIHIAASSTVIDYVTRYGVHRIFNTKLKHSNTYFTFKFDEI